MINFLKTSKFSSLFTDLKLEMFRKSPDVQIDTGESAAIVKLPASKKRIHVIQFLQPLTPERPYFCLEIIKLSRL